MAHIIRLIVLLQRALLCHNVGRVDSRRKMEWKLKVCTCFIGIYGTHLTCVHNPDISMYIHMFIYIYAHRLLCYYYYYDYYDYYYAGYRLDNMVSPRW